MLLRDLIRLGLVLMVIACIVVPPVIAWLSL